MNSTALWDERTGGESGVPVSGDFRVDGWLVQPDLNRAARGDTMVHLRPQLVDLLACLATQPGRVFSKDQLLATVWRERFVAATGVARCVAELRQALSDDARQPRIIETIPKRGYRLLAQVERIRRATAATASGVASPAATVVDPHAAHAAGSWSRLARLVTAMRSTSIAAMGLLGALRHHVRVLFA